MDSFLSNIFPWMGQQQKQARAAAEAAATMEARMALQTPSPLTLPPLSVSMEIDVSDTMEYAAHPSPDTTNNNRKRNRRLSTPTLISSNNAIVTPCHSDSDDTDDATLIRPKKMFRGTTQIKVYCIDIDESSAGQSHIHQRDCSSSVTPSSKYDTSTTPSIDSNPIISKSNAEDEIRIKALKEKPLDVLPEDILAHALSYLNDVSNRFALQGTSKQFHRICSTPVMMNEIVVGGDPTTGLHGIISETDTTETAARKLTPFAAVGNLEAMYMPGIIKSYCDCDFEDGISLLKMASSRGYVRASYALGLVLRDTNPDDALFYMSIAADQKYLPALQELLPARDMKLQYGEPNADELRIHMDHLCLNRLLTRHYILSSHLRYVNTSHCWNHLCGRWAYKATAPSTSNTVVGTTSRDPTSLQQRRRGSNISSNTSLSSASTSSISSETSMSSSTLELQKNRVSRMKMCSRCCRAKYCSKLCQVYDWRSGRHKMECQFL